MLNMCRQEDVTNKEWIELTIQYKPLTFETNHNINYGLYLIVTFTKMLLSNTMVTKGGGEV
mgnify:FL=1